MALLARVAAFALAMAVSCAGAATLVYVGNAGSQDISVLRLGDDGRLSPVGTVAVPGPAGRGDLLPLAVSPNRKALYAALGSPPFTVVTFSIDWSTGMPRYAGSAPLEASMAYIATDRTGRFLLAASYQGHLVTVSPIGEDGIVSATQQVIETQPHAHCIVADGRNRYVLHTSLGGDLVYQQRFDELSGRLTPSLPAAIEVKANAGPRHLAFSPDDRFVYVLNERDASIYVFPWDAAGGTLKKEKQVASALPRGFSGKPWAADLHLTPDGRYLYASERTSSTLAAFRVEATEGTLEPIGSFPTEKQPRDFAIDPSGRYLLAAGERSHSVSVHAIDPETGRLTALARHPVGNTPSWVEAVALP